MLRGVDHRLLVVRAVGAVGSFAIAGQRESPDPIARAYPGDDFERVGAEHERSVGAAAGDVELFAVATEQGVLCLRRKAAKPAAPEPSRSHDAGKGITVVPVGAQTAHVIWEKPFTLLIWPMGPSAVSPGPEKLLA